MTDSPKLTLTQLISLHNTEGSSDKVYNLFALTDQTGRNILVRSYGRRGGHQTVNTDIFPSAASRDKALHKTATQKLSKCYRRIKPKFEDHLDMLTNKFPGYAISYVEFDKSYAPKTTTKITPYDAEQAKAMRIESLDF